MQNISLDTNKISFIYFNSRSICNKISLLQDILIDKNPSVLALTETWLNSEYTDHMLLGGLPYSVIRIDRQRMGGGVALLIRDHFPYSIVKTINKNWSGILIKAQFEGQWIAISIIYRPPNTKVHECDGIIEFLEFSSTLGLNTLIIGDFNIPDSHYRLPMYKQFFEDNDLMQHVNEPTCGENILDFVITDRELVISNLTYTPPIGNSDHVGISFLLDIRSSTKRLAAPHPDFKNADYLTMKNELRCINWEESLSGFANIDELYDKFCLILIRILSRTVPLRTASIAFKTYPDYIQRIKKRRDFVYTRLSRDRRLLGVFKQLSDKLMKCVNAFEKQKEEKFLARVTNKELFSFIRSKLGNKSSGSSLLNESNELVTDSSGKCKALASYFASVYANNEDVLPDVRPWPNISLSSFLILPRDVFENGKNLKTSCTLTADGLPQIVFKRCISELSLPLAHIFNISMQLGQVPSTWKRAVVIAIPKVPNASVVTQFRPISLLPTPVKLMEKLIKNKIESHITRFGILPNCQYGFRSKTSISDLMLKCETDWRTAISNQKCVDIVYADIKKAFDRVNHRKLLNQLKRIGISNQLLLWFQSYFENRTFCVKYDDKISDFYPAPSGVPQGAVLSPLLFNIYISDILKWRTLPQQVKLYQFADDLKLYVIFDRSQEYEHSEALQGSLDIICDYLFSLNLELNPEKSQVLHLGRNNPKMIYHVNMNVLKSIENDSIRDLGIRIDSKLTYRDHIQEISMKAKRSAFQILRIFKTTKVSLLIRLFTIYSRPILEFGLPVWTPVFEYQKKTIENVQRIYTRIIWQRSNSENADRPNYSDRLKMYKLNSLQDRRAFIDACYLRKIMLSNSKCSFSDLFTLQPTRSRSSKFKVFSINFRNGHSMSTFVNRAAVLLENSEFVRYLCLPEKCFRKKVLEQVDSFRVL